MPLRRKAARTVRAWDAAVRGRSRSAMSTTRPDNGPTAELSRNNKACAQLFTDQRLSCSTWSSRGAGNVARNAFEMSMVSVYSVYKKSSQDDVLLLSIDIRLYDAAVGCGARP